MTPMADAALVIGGSFAASLVVKATVILILALVGTRLVRRTRAAIRHVVLAAAFAALLALPIAAIVSPSIHVEVPVGAPGVAASPAAAEPFEAGGPADAAVAAATPTMDRFSALPLSTLLIAAWAGGMLVCLLPVFAGLWQVRCVRRRGVPWLHGRAMVHPLAEAAGIRRAVDVLLHESMPGPVTCGVWRPAIVLPSDAQDWHDAEVRRALVHELEHVRRGDWVTQCLARVLCAVYWFHPLAWVSWRQLVLEAERTCDDAVLRFAEPIAYADQLVTLAQRMAGPGRPLLAMANRADLSARVTAVLDARQSRGHAGTGVVVAAASAAVVIVALIAPMQTVAATQTPAQTDAAPQAVRRLAFEVASVRPHSADEPGRAFGFNAQKGTLNLVNQTFLSFIQAAYSEHLFPGFPEDRITGGPPWIRSERFTIIAKAPPAALPLAGGNRDMAAMLRTLLTERFKLAIRVEMRQSPVYALVRARRDGKLGPQLKPMKEQDAAARRGVGGGRGRFVFAGATMTLLAASLRETLGRPVLDETGFTELFDGSLEWTPAPDEFRQPDPASPGQPAASGPSLFTALEEQLGLKLEARRAPVEFLVVEHVERPTEN